jgi:hypothetical protein
MLSPIDHYQQVEMTVAEADSLQADQFEAQEISKGQWDAITAPFMQNLLASGKSSAYWEGFISELADRAGVSFALFPQPHLTADEF